MFCWWVDEVAYGAKRADGLSWRRGTQAMAHGPAGLHQLLPWRLQARDPKTLGSRVLDGPLHLELECDGSHGQWLLHRCQQHSTRHGNDQQWRTGTFG